LIALVWPYGFALPDVIKFEIHVRLLRIERERGLRSFLRHKGDSEHHHGG
jgi:hypothetical protein